MTKHRHKNKKTAVTIISLLITAIIVIAAVFIKFGLLKPDGDNADSSVVSSDTTASKPEKTESADSYVSDTVSTTDSVVIEDLLAVMYATIDLNVRAAPNTGGQVIGLVKSSEEVTVSGKCSNGWYRVDLGTAVGFCFGKYLSYEKPSPVVMPYCLKVNLSQNTVTVYSSDESGDYNVPVKAMVCSSGAGGNTPTGTFKTSDKYVWRLLSGNVYGQYCTRITGSYLFHSVPYFTKDKGDLEYEEYNKLGQPASLGCIRLSVADAKWIYDNCPKGTSVTIYYSDEPEPITPQSPVIIDVTDPRRGWDPTDPDPANPWLTQ